LLKSLTCRIALSLAVAAALTAAAPARADVPAAAAALPLVQTGEQALAQDAAEYARQLGIAPEEALRRLRAQEQSVAETDRLQHIYRDRLAGISVEHRPDYRIVLLLTGDEPVADRTIRAGGMDVPVVFRTGAAATREEVLAAIRLHQAEIRDVMPRPPGIGADARTGELVVMARGLELGDERETELEARFAALTGVPVRVETAAGSDALLSIEGGARVIGPEADGKRQYCTAGFVVTDGARTGLVTAAHCPDSLAYRSPRGGDVPLEYVGQWGWSYQDVQVNVSAAARDPVFYADTGKTALRRVGGTRSRASTRAGDVVCHRGETSGYSCALIEMVDYAPPGDLCGGPCAAVWVAVAGPTCRGGDSGGPAFAGTTAFGIVKGASFDRSGRCDLYYYMSTDYLPTGWSLLRG
jgi:hypothetical protein